MAEDNNEDQFEPDSMIGYRVNRIKSLIHIWYALFEVHAFDTQKQILELCHEEGFELHLGPVTITSVDVFGSWYLSVFGRFTRSYHDIHGIDVTLIDDIRATAFTRFTHTINLDGQPHVFEFISQMRLIETACIGPKVVYYQPVLQPT